MSGWCPSLLLWCAEWRWCVLRWSALSSSTARALPVPVRYSLVLQSCRVLSLLGVWRVCLRTPLVWWGILCPLPPHSGGGWGHREWWGGMTRWGGIVMKGGSVVGSPVRVLAFPLVVRSVPLVEWRDGVCAVMPPPSDWVWDFRVVLLPSCHPRFSFACVWWHDAL